MDYKFNTSSLDDSSHTAVTKMMQLLEKPHEATGLV